jgi:prevent-host-death family protein
MLKSVPIAEIEAHPRSWFRAAEAGESILVTRQGRPVAALVPAAKLEQQEQEMASQPESGAGLAGLAGGWEGSDELVKLVGRNRRSRRRSHQRIG